MSYNDKELQRAKEILEPWVSVSPSTKGCYSSRIAMWIHFCNVHCAGDDIITPRRLADYVEWLVTSGAIDRIRQRSTHIQQVLRSQLQGVLCYWRIQNDGNPDIVDPRLSPIFVERWQQIAMRYPRPRQARRTEPIYGAHRSDSSPDQSTDVKHQAPGTVTHISHINGANRPASDRPAVAGAGAGASAGAANRRPSLAPSAVPAPGYPSAIMTQHHGHRSPPQPHANHAGAGAWHPYGAPSHRQQLPPVAPRPPHGFPGKPSYPGACPILPGPRSPGAGSRTSDYRLPPPASMAAMEPPRPMASNLPVSAQPSRAASTEVSPRPDTPQAVPTAVAVERAPQGQLPAVAPVWEGDHAAAPEGHLLNASEAVALSIRQLAAGTSVQIQARAHSMLGMAAWLPAATRSTLALSDLAIEEPFARVPAVLPVPDQQAADTDAASRGRSYSTADSADSAASEDPATPPLKAISVALPAGAAKDSRAVVLRHANPLLCSWSALALCLFARWHVANDATPDFSSTEWQTLRLFPDIAAGPEPAENDFARLFAAATAEITNDKIDGAQAMRDAGFFFADALGLVRPTATGVKGLDAVGAVDASVLRPDVLLALTRANAGYSADATKPIVAPRRAGMQPPPSLLKEVFPWLKATLIGAFTQNTNNDDVQAARRVLQVLRELRVVLLQDVAFLLEVPSVAAAIKDSPIFGHALFASPEFVAFREDMRRAVGDSEIRAIESLCVAALGWTDERKQQMPDGAAERMLPTAPRLPSPSCTAVPQGPEAGALKRPLENEDSRTLDDERSALAAPTDPSVSPKRARRADSALPTPLGNRVFGEAAVPVVAGTADAMPEPVAATATVARMAQTIGELRSENDDLKAHLRRLEWSLSQHKAEMRSWMNRVEVTLRRVGSTHGAQPMPDSVISHHAERLGMAIHRPQLPGAPLSKYSAAASQHQQQQQQQPPYASGSYHEPASHRDSSTTLLPAHRDSMYERQPGMYSARQSPALAQRSQPASVEYRTAGPAGMSPRNPAYASRRAPGVEYADHHYGAQYPSAPSRQPPPSYGFPEHDGYSWRSDAQYASVPRGGRH